MPFVSPAPPPVPKPKRIVLLGVLWTFIGLTLWLMAFQLALIVFSSKGEWQAPDFYQVTVVSVEKTSSNAFTRDVNVTIDGEAETITLPKPDAAKLRPFDTVWVLDNFYATPIRSAQFILTPGRVLNEYPELILLLAILGVLRIRRTRWGFKPEPAPVPEGERIILRDTFHARAGRHAAEPAEAPLPSSPGAGQTEPPESPDFLTPAEDQVSTSAPDTLQ